MVSLLGILCRAWKCTLCGPSSRGRDTEKTEGNPSDDLTAIQGIGIAIQNRLNTSGIKSYAQLAQASPEDLRAVLGKRASGAKVEDWIAEARKLAKEAAPHPA